MAETKTELLEKILSDLKKVGSVKGSAVISRDGLMVAADLSNSIDADTFAAMSAAMQGAAETAIQELKQGELNQIIIDSSKGKIISIGAGENAILVALAERNLNLGLALLSLGRASGKIADTLKG